MPFFLSGHVKLFYRQDPASIVLWTHFADPLRKTLREDYRILPVPALQSDPAYTSRRFGQEIPGVAPWIFVLVS